jgi:uncharacterized glyoxalase superfamily protein PhnB
MMFARNRSAPDAGVITVLFYPDAPAAADWLTTALPFTERLRNSEDRRQLVYGNGAVVVTTAGFNAEEPASVTRDPGASLITLRVTDVDGLCERARQSGAQVLSEPADKPYGERQCTIVDPWGHAWTLSETKFDSNPADWGGQLFDVSPADTLPELLALEEQGWDALSTDARTARTFYGGVLTDEAMMVFPGGIVLQGKHAILDALGQPWSRHRISEAAVVSVSSGVQMLSYRVVAQREGQDEYRARITSIYRRDAASWRLVFHQQTMEG